MDRNAIRNMLLLAVLSASIILPVAAATTQSIISVGTADSDQWYPAVSGNRIAWVDYRGGTGEIYLYDILTGEELRVSPEGAMCDGPAISGDRILWRVYNESTGGYDLDILDLAGGGHTLIVSGGVDHANPDIDGSRVVWDDMRTGDTDIYLYDLATGEETRITSDPAYQVNPDVSMDRIVWQDDRNGNWDIFVHDLTTGEETCLDCLGDDQTNAAISGDRVVWQDLREGPDGDIYLYDFTDGNGRPLTTDDDDQFSPAISGDRVVWEDISEGNTEIILHFLASGEESDLTGDPGEQVFPAIDDNRVVWTDYRNGMADIYLGTLGTDAAVPEAEFSTNVTIGGSPLTVRFTDESTGDPTTWRWDFGDGETSTEQHPVHTYGPGGTYPVTLTVSSPAGRSQSALPDFIHCGSGPSPSFTADPVYGITPLTVQFTDTSTGDPTTWSWDFGDGETSDEPDPAHTYVEGGTYTAKLEAGNLFGEESWTLGTPIEVLNGTQALASTDIGGLTVEECGGIQCASVDPSAFTSLVFDPTTDPTVISLVPDPASGWGRITLQARDTGFSDRGDGILTGTLTGVVLESIPLRPSTFSPQTGQNLEVTYALNLSGFPALASVDITAWENVTIPDYPRFLQAAYDANYASISAVAYTVDFSTENLAGVRSATLDLSVLSSWVDRYGVSGNITLLRLGDDGSTQGIRYRDAVTDPATGITHFLYVSPKGLSRFALASTSGSGNPFQLLVLSAGTRASSGSQTGHSSNDFPQGFPTDAPRPVQVTEPLSFQETGVPEVTGTGTTTRLFTLTAADGGASLVIAPGTRLTNAGGLPIGELSVLPAGSAAISPPEGSYYTYAGAAYDLQPDGMIFDPTVEVQFHVDPARWQDGARYQVLARKGEGEPWEVVPTREDDATRTVTATVGHFSLHALFTWPAPVTTPVQEVPTLQAAPKQVPRTPLTTISGGVLWAAGMAYTHIPGFMLVLLLIGGVTLTLRRGVPLKGFRPWVFLYLISLTAYLWASFLALTGGPLWVSAWIFVATAGLNLIVHLLRFDRIVLIPAPAPMWTGSRR